MNVFQWALSHVSDFVALEQLGAKLIADRPTTSGHGEWIAYALRHRDDFAAVEALVAKIAGDFPHAAAATLDSVDCHPLATNAVLTTGLSATTLVNILKFAKSLVPLIPGLSAYAATIDGVLDALIAALGG